MTTINEVLRKYRKLEKTRSGESHKAVAVSLSNDLMLSPEVVSDIAFDEIIELKTRMDILLVWSKDHKGSCSTRHNPRWAKMMRKYIIPRIDDLPRDIQENIKWYQNVHGL